jgi:hypothetical protein
MTVRQSPAFPHYLRFARSLALLTTLGLPACSSGDGADDTKTEKTPAATSVDVPPSPPAPAPAPAASASASTTDDAGTSDASPGKVSGPLPPPELPLELA